MDIPPPRLLPDQSDTSSWCFDRYGSPFRLTRQGPISVGEERAVYSLVSAHGPRDEPVDGALPGPGVDLVFVKDMDIVGLWLPSEATRNVGKTNGGGP